MVLIDVSNCSSDDYLPNNKKSATKFRREFKDKLIKLLIDAEEGPIIRKFYHHQKVSSKTASELFSALRKSFFLNRELNKKFNNQDRFDYKTVNDKLLEIDQKLLYILSSQNVYNDLKDLLDLFKSTKDDVLSWLKKWNTRKINAVLNGTSYKSYNICIIQVWFESLFDCLSKIEAILDPIECNDKKVMNSTIKQCNIELIERSFVLEVEPTQVIRCTPK